jgi:hypothetical protein
MTDTAPAAAARPLTNAKVGAALRKLGLTKAVTRTTVDVHGYGKRTTGDYQLQTWGDGEVRVILVARTSRTTNDRRYAEIRAAFEAQDRAVDALDIGGLVIR